MIFVFKFFESHFFTRGENLNLRKSRIVFLRDFKRIEISAKVAAPTSRKASHSRLKLDKTRCRNSSKYPKPQMSQTESPSQPCFSLISPMDFSFTYSSKSMSSKIGSSFIKSMFHQPSEVWNFFSKFPQKSTLRLPWHNRRKSYKLVNILYLDNEKE